jgi:antirestriction protein ArdC
MNDVHAVITERFIEQLRAGCVPWQRPWRSVQNIISRKSYRGINALTLGSTRFGSPFWMTFRQAFQLGGHVRKGERSTPIVYYKFLAKRDANGNQVFTAKGKPAHIPFVRWSNAFNLEQTEGVEAPELPPAPADVPALARAEALVQGANLCPIRHEGFAAAYSPREDLICMPDRAIFKTSEKYYHTLFHEMTHATGHGSRLDREGITNPSQFGSERYSKEELIAELGAAFLSNDVGILNQVVFENSAAYLDSWIKKFEDDYTLLTSAASHAQRSFDWIAGRPNDETENLEPAIEARMQPANTHAIISASSVSRAPQSTDVIPNTDLNPAVRIRNSPNQTTPRRGTRLRPPMRSTRQGKRF